MSGQVVLLQAPPTAPAGHIAGSGEQMPPPASASDTKPRALQPPRTVAACPGHLLTSSLS